MLNRIKTRQSSAEVEQKRRIIVEMLSRQSAGMKSAVLKSISTEDLRLLIHLYDVIFYQLQRLPL